MLNQPFIPENSADINGRFSVCSGVIETIDRTDGYMFDGIITRMNINDPNSMSNISIINQGWRELENETNL